MADDIKLTSDRAAAVNHSVYWIDVNDVPPPRGAKLQLINKRFGVATYGAYTPNQGWTHWQGVPKFKED